MIAMTVVHFVFDMVVGAALSSVVRVALVVEVLVAPAHVIAGYRNSRMSANLHLLLSLLLSGFLTVVL